MFLFTSESALSSTIFIRCICAELKITTFMLRQGNLISRSFDADYKPMQYYARLDTSFINVLQSF